MSCLAYWAPYRHARACTNPNTCTLTRPTFTFLHQKYVAIVKMFRAIGTMGSTMLPDNMQSFYAKLGLVTLGVERHERAHVYRCVRACCYANFWLVHQVLSHAACLVLSNARHASSVQYSGMIIHHLSLTRLPVADYEFGQPGTQQGSVQIACFV